MLFEEVSFLKTDIPDHVQSVKSESQSVEEFTLEAMHAMRCPYLKKIPTSVIKQNAKSVLTKASCCPVMTHVMKYASYLTETSVKEAEADPFEKCPFVGNDDTAKSPEAVISMASRLAAADDFCDSNSPPVQTNPQTVFKAADHTIAYELSKMVKMSDLPTEREFFNYANFFRSQIDKKKRDNTYRVFKKVKRQAENYPYASVYSGEEKNVQIWCSNDYMGMTFHPRVQNAIIRAVKEQGVGTGGTRSISGNTIYHVELESELANLHKKGAALLFTSCFVANDSTLMTLGKSIPGCQIFSDAGNHASMIQGIKNSGVPKHIFRHNDAEHLEELLRKVDVAIPKVVAFETVHSMSGDVCPLKELCEVAHRYGALTFVDEVHAVGLYGETGAGIAERDGLMDEIDIVSGTLGKAYGNSGGYIAGTTEFIDTMRSYAAGFIFTTALPPTNVAGALEAVRVLSGNEGRMLRQRHQTNVRYLRQKMVEAGLPVLPAPSHIIPIKVHDAVLAAQLSNDLMEKTGHYIQAINYPTVPKGKEVLRLTPSPHHTTEQMNGLVKDLVHVFKINGVTIETPSSDPDCVYCNMPTEFDILKEMGENVELPLSAASEL
ncbi:5-aminolevulinate synthase, erythroid-specific, mitochondrial-like [Lineus longissimus]|uniref:5-aminolevulinate synthase, erythroid-specific, mitochondrial-like n=1 Tax=Lineus longissimus TaxID=88925 RepID=UPI00315C7FDC